MPSLPGAAGVAIRIALQDDEHGHNQLVRYLQELDEADLERLADAAQALADTAADAIGRLHS